MFQSTVERERHFQYALKEYFATYEIEDEEESDAE